MKPVYSIAHEEFAEMMDVLAEQILDYEKSHQKIHYLVGIPRGGLVPAVYLSHRTGIEVATIGEVLNKASSAPVIVMCDEIVDSGETWCRVKKQLKDGHFTLENVLFASPIVKTCAKERPDFYVRVFGKGIWVKFPWEVNNAPQSRDCDKE